MDKGTCLTSMIREVSLFILDDDIEEAVRSR